MFLSLNMWFSIDKNFIIESNYKINYNFDFLFELALYRICTSITVNILL